jgi:predicted nucleic acid-binding protein
MPKPRVYVESTIPSAYYTSRTDPGMVVSHITTHAWWDVAVRSCELVTSPAVLREVAQGRSVHVPKRLALLHDLELVVSNAEIAVTVAVYIQQRLMPQDPEGDALHLALASHYKCDVLATWNYHHLANPNKLDRIRRLNGELGLPVPRIASPLELIEEIA